MGIVPLMCLIVKGSLLIAVGEQKKQEVQSRNTSQSWGSRLLLPATLGTARSRLYGITLNFKVNNPDYKSSLKSKIKIKVSFTPFKKKMPPKK